MSISSLTLYFMLGFLLMATYIKFIYLPIHTKRSKRRVMQDNSVFIPSGSSPFAEATIEVNDEISVNSELTSLQETLQNDNRHETEISIDITSLRTPPTSINALFPQTSVLMN